MNKKTLDILLRADRSKLVRPSTTVEIKRLSKVLGDKVVLTVNALLPNEFGELKENMNISAGGEISLANDLEIMTLVKAIPELRDKELREAFGVITPKELINKLLLPGEVSALYSTISDLSGFGNDAVEEVKN